MNSSGFAAGTQGYGNRGYGGGSNLYGFARYRGGYGSSYFGGNGYGRRQGRFVWVHIPHVGWVLAPPRVAMRMGY